jgi:hypothetical protein
MCLGAGVQGRLFLDTPGTCAGTPATLANEIAASRLIAESAESLINMRLWPAAVSLEVPEYGNIDIRSLEMELTSSALSGLLLAPGTPNVLLQVRHIFFPNLRRHICCQSIDSTCVHGQGAFVQEQAVAAGHGAKRH